VSASIVGRQKLAGYLGITLEELLRTERTKGLPQPDAMFKNRPIWKPSTVDQWRGTT
jgi:hypothetical protein